MILWYHLFMGLFGKKKENEEEFEDEDELSAEDNLQDRKLTRRFRDLNSQNRKKRKEPPKPWGKGERILVLVVMLVTILISSVLFLSSTSNVTTDGHGIFQMPNVKLQNIDFSSFNIFKEGTIEIRKK